MYIVFFLPGLTARMAISMVGMQLMGAYKMWFHSKLLSIPLFTLIGPSLGCTQYVNVYNYTLNEQFFCLDSENYGQK